MIFSYTYNFPYFFKNVSDIQVKLQISKLVLSDNKVSSTIISILNNYLLGPTSLQNNKKIFNWKIIYLNNNKLEGPQRQFNYRRQSTTVSISKMISCTHDLRGHSLNAFFYS